MKNKIKTFFIIIALKFANIFPERQFLDGIACTRTGESGCSVIFYSDAWFISPIGMQVKLEDLIIKMSWLHHGNEHGIKMINDGSSMEYAEKYLDMIQDQRGIGRIELEKACMDSGYSLYDLKKELNDQYLIQQIIETTFAASGLINIIYEEIEEYYNNNPQIIPAQYSIAIGKLNVNLDEYNNNKYNEDDIQWDDDLIELTSNDLTENFKNISENEINDIVNVQESKNKNYITLYRLNNKIKESIIPLSDCYEKIMNNLQQKKYLKEYKNYTENLINENMYDNPEIKEKTLIEAKKEIIK